MNVQINLPAIELISIVSIIRDRKERIEKEYGAKTVCEETHILEVLGNALEKPLAIEKAFYTHFKDRLNNGAKVDELDDIVKEYHNKLAELD